MTMSGKIRSEFSTWIGLAADAAIAAIGRIRVQQRVELIETSQNSFTMRMASKPTQSAPPDFHFELADEAPSPALPDDWKPLLRGSRFEIVLRSSRFLFRPLDLPKRAVDFLEAMVRSQIDRLTPWAANDVVFSWTAPVEASNERIDLTVIAAPKAKIDPLVRLAEDCGTGSVLLFADVKGSDAADEQPATPARVKVFEKRMRASLDTARVSRILTIILLAMAVSATLSLSAAAVVGGRLEAHQRQLSRNIAERRAAMRLKLAASDDAGQSMLARRKHVTPSNVLVLDALSQILPDNTYVSELRIENDKLQIVGITQDAPSLVKLMEQSPHFTRATFFAPTTRSAGDRGERFHVEAHIKPYFGSGI